MLNQQNKMRGRSLSRLFGSMLVYDFLMAFLWTGMVFENAWVTTNGSSVTCCDNLGLLDGVFFGRWLLWKYYSPLVPRIDIWYAQTKMGRGSVGTWAGKNVGWPKVFFWYGPFEVEVGLGFIWEGAPINGKLTYCFRKPLLLQDLASSAPRLCQSLARKPFIQDLEPK